MGNIVFVAGYVKYEMSLWENEAIRNGIIGGIVAVVLLVALFVLICCLCKRRKRRRENKKGENTPSHPRGFLLLSASICVAHFLYFLVFLAVEKSLGFESHFDEFHGNDVDTLKKHKQKHATAFNHNYIADDVTTSTRFPGNDTDVIDAFADNGNMPLHFPTLNTEKKPSTPARLTHTLPAPAKSGSSTFGTSSGYLHPTFQPGLMEILSEDQRRKIERNLLQDERVIRTKTILQG